MFDPTLKKKKKKKKTTFDMDSAFNEGGNTDGDAVESSIVDKENQEPEPAVIEEDEALDLENFGKKKKKKKKAFNLDELEAALPESKKEVKQIGRLIFLLTVVISLNLVYCVFTRKRNLN